MPQPDIHDVLMPNTYVRLLAQEFDDTGQITRGTGIGQSDLAQYPHPVTVRQHLRCIENVLALRRSPDWHLRWGKHMAENFHGAVTLAWLTAPTLGDGLDTFIRYMPGRVPYLRWRGEHAGEVFRCTVQQRVHLGAVHEVLVEVPLIVMHEYVRAMRLGPMAEARVELAHAPVVTAELYEAAFACPVAFECARNALVIPEHWRRVANVDFDPNTWEASLARCEAQAAIRDERDVRTRVRHALVEALEPDNRSGLPTLEHVAARLNLSPRTVIRRLRALDTTFQSVADEVLSERAAEMLHRPGSRVHAIAAQLGYSDAASFRKAFHRWFGMAPARYREQR